VSIERGDEPLPPRRRIRGGRWWWLVLGVVVFVALSPLLYFMLVYFSWSHNDLGSDSPSNAERVAARASRIQELVRDGTLTDRDIQSAGIFGWVREENASELRLTTDLASEGRRTEPCYLVIITVPLGPNSKVLLVPDHPCADPAVVPSLGRSGTATPAS
jgi:hypothetical protein